MQTSDLLIEVGLEEVPARFLEGASEQLEKKVRDLLTDQHIPFEKIRRFSTPRRLAVLVEAVSETQEDTREEVKGPSKKVALDQEGNWTKAAVGFSKGQGKTVEDIYFKDVNGTEYAYVEKYIKGKETIQILMGINHVIEQLVFPKNMKWGNYDLRYIRPIRWIVALFGKEIIPFKTVGVESGRVTYGHRFLGGKTAIEHPHQYKELLLSQFVVADQEDRKEAIISQLKQLEEEHGWVIPIDEDLLNEVTNLVEYPTVLYGSFDEEYLELPGKVLITTMKEHQRYFPVTDKNGRLLSYFVTVRNGDHHHMETVRRGNEKVLRARLQDAVFFYQEDKKMPLEQYLEKLSRVVYHDEIGTYAEKLQRIRHLSQYIAEALSLPETEVKKIVRAAEICKFDLVTQMVDEFPELQGYMGEQFALNHGENPEVAKAINEHYLPRQADGKLPAGDIGAIVGIADKLDTIISLFSIGLIPSGSEDPYGLRRQATGIVQILADRNWSLDLQALIRESIAVIEHFRKLDIEQLINEVNQFFKLRFIRLLEERGMRYDIISALLEEPVHSVPSLLKKAQLLNEIVNDPEFKTDVEALSRVINIAKKSVPIQNIDTGLFENKSERQLYNDFLKVKEKLENADEAEYFRLLISLKGSINQYFDHTMVMAENEAIRNNRLALMTELKNIILRFAHFQKMVLK